ncbi:hypothetical protein SLS62_004948 [Diatrype stigma]|uniref:Ribosomal protein S8 n=1 Tax=Diatrype stigma TaxID=117547 RepID=A0AAN9V1W9_9PEZI
MAIANVVKMCSHLRNATKARLGLTSVPHTKYNLKVALVLHRAGYLSFVTRGGTTPPDPATIATFEPEDLTTDNVARQRLWLGLRYHSGGTGMVGAGGVGAGGTPVLGEIVSLSTSKRPITANLPALRKLARGFDASYQKGLNLGECLVVGTDLGVLEAREAIEKEVGGLLLCRVGP